MRTRRMLHRWSSKTHPPFGAPFATGADELCMKAVFSHPVIEGTRG